MAEDANRIATVTDGLDAVLLLATLVAGLRGVETRTDLQYAEARDELGSMSPGSLDLLLVAPRPGNRSSDMLKAIIACGEDIGASVFVVLAEGSPMPEGLPQDVRYLLGPPFPKGTRQDLEAAARALPLPPKKHARSRFGGLTMLTGRRRRNDRHEDRNPGHGASSATNGMQAAPLEAIAVQGVAGGVGTTTVAVGLAVGLARRFASDGSGRDVCLIDLDLQFGSAACYLGLPGNSRVSDVYRNIGRLDAEAFRACLQTAEPGLQVFSAPPDLVPMDALGSSTVEELLDFALNEATSVIIDMPTVVTDWSEEVYRHADRTYIVNSLEIRSSLSAQKRARMMNALALPAMRYSPILNRAPSGREQRATEWRLRRESYERGIESQFTCLLPDGGNAVAAASDLGQPLQDAAARNPLTVALTELARGLADEIRPLPAPGEAKLARA